MHGGERGLDKVREGWQAGVLPVGKRGWPPAVSRTPVITLSGGIWLRINPEEWECWVPRSQVGWREEEGRGQEEYHFTYLVRGAAHLSGLPRA